MSFQAPISIADAISRIAERRLLLPAIQREFVWTPQKIEWLFDSLLQGYPFGSFLFWEIRDSDAKNQFRYYEFLREYRERFKTHNPEFNTQGHYDFDAVLDGQQRLTSLYIGLKGTYASKMPRVWWEDSEHALPTRKLYLNVSKSAAESDDEDEPGRRFEFRLLTSTEVAKSPNDWFRVGEILEVTDAYKFNRMLHERGYYQSEFAATALSTLHSVIHINKTINYYLIQKSDIERALNVFVRVNSGGEQLSLSDMLMSTAIANWKKLDARAEILGLVDSIQERGFFVSKDLVLKTCLYLYSSDIRYKVSNFSASQVRPFEDNWETIKESILAVFDLARDFGYNEKSLTSKNTLLPIVYWVHHRGIAKGITKEVGLREDRDIIRRWWHVMLLKGVFGASADTVLAAIRRAFLVQEFGKPFVRPELEIFPAQQIALVLQQQGKDPAVSDEFLDLLLYTQCEDKLAFSILALLAPNLDYKNGNFDKDHLHPASAFSWKGLLIAGVPEADRSFFYNSQHWDSILNLAHLDSNENRSKQSKPLAEWVNLEAERQMTTHEKFCIDHNLPLDPEALELVNFKGFIQARRTLLRKRLADALQYLAEPAATTGAESS
ncbi:MAG TPA: DUF262 domain-containing protein [Bryobacteraceae bacterium]|jgi:hypothetical protein|nr:DUF262 domain-containing protein [Bryobacteraceae bacterium]